MTAQKRSFDNFALDSDSTIPVSALDGFGPLSKVVNRDYGAQLYPEGIWQTDQSSNGMVENDTLFAFAPECDYGFLPEQDMWAEADGMAMDPLAFYEMNSDPLTQDSSNSTSTHVLEPPEDTELNNVCYGMIYLTKAKMIGSMQTIEQELKGLNDMKDLNDRALKSHHLLDIVWHHDELFLALPSGLRAAQLNQQINDALQGLVSQGRVKLQALVHKDTILSDIARATTLKNSETNVNINVYGSGELVQDVGKCLSEHKVWLQRPDWHPVESTYANPHVIHFAELQTSDATDIVQSDAVPSNESPTIQVENIYSQLSRAGRLQGIAGDSRLTTQLLPHQQEALGFMMQREQAEIPDEFKLWATEMAGEDVFYRHKITGQKVRTLPDEHGGGILADEMGMGKTFSTIALIIATLEAANVWAHDREVHLSENIPAFKTLSRATLVVVPSPLLLGAWKKELRKHTQMSLNVLVYHGAERNVDRASLARQDIVLTTYHTLVADCARNVDLMTQLAWYRIVLDEAHFIRRPSTLLHKRVAELDAKFRWCLTGTPIQNSLDDVGALFSFLNITPFNRLGYFRRFISANHSDGIHRSVLAQNNLIKLLDAMCIRRTKDDINLCPVNENVRFVELSPEERKQYDSMKEDMVRAMHNIVGESDSRQRFGSFQAKLQLRLLCNHGTYQNHFHWAKMDSLLDGYRESFDRSVGDGSTACSICGSSDSMLLLEDDLTYTSNCVHVLCSTCRRKSHGQCPLCDKNVRCRSNTDSLKQPDSWTRRDLQRTGQSSKMEALVHDLDACREDKSIVFSCWTTTLELIAHYLGKHNIPFDRIDGEQSIAHRQKVLDAFLDDPKMSVLIMTTGVGAFGLDLIAANRVFLVEPQWNPSVESQAVGRTTRIGQHKTVQVTRYIMRDTVEEELRDLQRRKRGMARMAEKDNSDDMVKAEEW